MLLFYDWEVFKYDNLVVIIVPQEKKTYVFANDLDSFKDFFWSHKDYIWVGYNSRNYDQYITKAAICGFDLKEVNDFIIAGNKGYLYSRLFREIPLLDYDVMSTYRGLKTLEAFMGHDIRETSVDFNIDRKLTPYELQETVKYCKHDVNETINVFLETRNDFNAHLDLINTFNLPKTSISRTKAQLTADILRCTKKVRDDEFKIKFVPTIKLHKYAFIQDWYKQPENMDYTKSLNTTVAGIEHTFKWGGVHAGRKQYHSKGLIVHIDAKSYYPSLMIKYDLLTRNCRHAKKFNNIYNKRLMLKNQGKIAEQRPYKIIINSTYGISKYKYSTAYDPLQANNVCINGQLLLLDLTEKLETIDGFELINTNTDGLIVKIPDTDEHFELLDDLCYEWEKRTQMTLEFEFISEIWQKDVNNYIFKYTDSDVLIRKGTYVKPMSALYNDLPIVNEAIVNRLVRHIPIEKTINDCFDLIMFQKVVQLSKRYLYAWHNGQRFTNKTFRVFASKDTRDGYIGKQKIEDGTIEKYANTPSRCFIDNGNILNKKIPAKLDKQWYIDLAEKRVIDFVGENLL